MSSAISESFQEQIDEMKIDTEMELQFLRDRGHPNGEEWVSKTADEVLGKFDAHIDDRDAQVGFG